MKNNYQQKFCIKIQIQTGATANFYAQAERADDTGSPVTRLCSIFKKNNLELLIMGKFDYQSLFHLYIEMLFELSRLRVSEHRIKTNLFDVAKT